MPATETSSAPLVVSVIIPARNEEASLGDCLQSLVSQTGVPFEIIVVDDYSTDRTREIAASFPGVRVIPAPPLLNSWTGKNNAVAAGASAARGKWLLFTDADTVHLPGSLARALAEGKEQSTDLLSYSPEQIAVSFWEMATLPVVFAELARQYPPNKVSDPASPIAAANGQYILVKHEAYDAVGGHAAIAGNILEDVALARALKTSGRKIRFRYAADAVRTRMYRNFRQLREGWTKNLALLFPNPGWLAVKSLLLWAIPWTALILLLARVVRYSWWDMVFVAALFYVTTRLRRANFDLIMQILGALFGMPMFAYLLLRSKRAHAKGTVSWKGRTYGDEHSATQTPSHTPKPLMKTPVALIFPAALFAVAASQLRLPAIHQMPLVEIAAQIPDSRGAPPITKTVIEPGLSIGPLKLGDTRARASELFPRKDEDQVWEDRCGTTLFWVDTTNRMGRGDLSIRLKKDKVFQIESSTTRFHTAEGITTFDPPGKVASDYKDLHAYTLLTDPVPSLGDRPLVFWMDKKKGIAFVFAYYPAKHQRYLYKIIVFQPGKNFCPEGESTDSPKWQEISPYSLEPPADLAPNLNRN